MTTAQPQRVFVFDLDDMLIWTSKAYSRAFITFYEYLDNLWDGRLLEVRTLGTISENIDLDLMEKINPDTGQVYGYSMHRFPESLVRTYHWLIDENHTNEAYSELVERQVRAIGYKAFDPAIYKEQGIVPGGIATLDFIRDTGDILILVTKGETIVQDNKIIELSLDEWFGEDIETVRTKDADTFRTIQDRFPECRVYSVGNSYKSDMLPAIEAGIEGIYVPYYTWLGEKAETKVDTKRVIVVQQIGDIIALIQTGRI